MKKSLILTMTLISLVLVVGFVSANFFDVFKPKVTGNLIVQGPVSDGDVITVYNKETITFSVNGKKHTLYGRYLLNGGKGYAFTLDGTKYELLVNEGIGYKGGDDSFGLTLTKVIIPLIGKRGAEFTIDLGGVPIKVCLNDICSVKEGETVYVQPHPLR